MCLQANGHESQEGANGLVGAPSEELAQAGGQPAEALKAPAEVEVKLEEVAVKAEEADGAEDGSGEPEAKKPKLEADETDKA